VLREDGRGSVAIMDASNFFRMRECPIGKICSPRTPRQMLTADRKRAGVTRANARLPFARPLVARQKRKPPKRGLRGKAHGGRRRYVGAAPQ
jgi:hypothetical protein